MPALLRSALSSTPSVLREPSPTLSDASTSSSDSPIKYATGVTPKKATRQAKDWRPPSTFYLKPFSEMTTAERICNLATCPESMHELKDEDLDRGPVPTQSVFRENLFILTRGMLPLVLQGLSYWAFPNFKWPLAMAYPIYLFAFMGFALQVLSRLNRYCVNYGTFDEKNIGRDRTPDASVNSLAKGITLYMLLRTGAAFYLHYDSAANPLAGFSWTYPLRLAAWQLTLDYFFYCYHRASHEVDALWFIHKAHHATKHPSAILAILAGDYQECIEIALVPLAATLLVPMSFSELYLTLCYTIYVEMLGHSGIRANWAHPILFVLKPFDMELCVEDHELHHRFGKSGLNYGKQSRFWDKLFGTSGERIETKGM